MRLYLEIYEVIPPDVENPPPPVTIRAELDDESQAEEVYQRFSDLFQGKKHIVQIHYCRHDEGKPCTTKILYDFSQ